MNMKAVRVTIVVMTESAIQLLFLYQDPGKAHDTVVLYRKSCIQKIKFCALKQPI